MLISCDAVSLEPAKYQNRTVKLERISKCPMCKASIDPIHLNTVFWAEDETVYFESHLFCTNCNHSFIGSYSSQLSSGTIPRSATLISVSPQKFSPVSFDENIKQLSPQFVKIYNQASAAEAYELDEIAGLGYRKALEFLVKDFSIHQHSDNPEEIKKLSLSQCIKKYIDNPQIKILVERSAWIGNDEAHYIRKQTNRDVSDMKSFIKATVYFIGMVLITEDAASIEPIK